MTALQGLRVIELASERIAFAGKLLADMGADVVLVEPPAGDPARAYPPFLEDRPGPDRSLWWWHYHTSKRGVVLDLDDAGDRARFKALIGTADMLLESEPHGRLARLGRDYEDLRQVRPQLIHLSVTPFGRTGPNVETPVTDLTILAGGGPVWNCGYDDHSLPPVRGAGNQGYQIGCHYAVMSALTALFHQLNTGEGQFIDISLHQAANVTTEAGSYNWLVNRSTVQRQTGRHAAPHLTSENQIRCRDGLWVNAALPVRKPSDFMRLLDWVRELGLEAELPEGVFLTVGAQWPALVSTAEIGVNDEATAVYAATRAALKLIAENLDAYDFFVSCQRRGIPAGVIYAPEEAYEDPHFRARGFQVEVEHPELERAFRYPGAPYHLPASPWRISRRAPKLGEHNQEILAPFGGD